MTVSSAEVYEQADGRSPFVHRFSTQCHNYVFDVNTSRVLRMPRVVWDIIEDVGVMSEPDLIAKHSGTHPSSTISDACAEIRKAQASGLLSAKRPAEIGMPFDEEEIREALASRRKSVTLVPTEQCNFRCTYCIYCGQYAHRRLHSHAQMSWDIAKRAIDEFLAHSTPQDRRSVRFYGGEALLNFPLVRRAIEYVAEERQQKDIFFSVATNGSLLRGEVADFLARYRTVLGISLDGPRHIHDRYRRLSDGAGTWQLVMDNVRAFVSKYPEYKKRGLRFHCVIAPPVDLRELEAFFGSCDLFEPGMGLSVGTVSDQDTTLTDCVQFNGDNLFGYHELYDQFVRNMKDGTLNRDRGEPALWVQTALFERTVLDFYKRGYASEQMPELPEKIYTMPMCVPGLQRLYVQTDGSYYPCERVQETEPFSIGNVAEGVSARKVHDLLRAYVDLDKDACRTCWCLPICQAGCITSVASQGKLDRQARRQACQDCRNSLHRIMASICEALEANPDALRYMDAIQYG